MGTNLFNQPVNLSFSPLRLITGVDHDVLSEVVHRVVERSNNNPVAGSGASLREHSAHVAEGLRSVDDQSVHHGQLTGTRQKRTALDVTSLTAHEQIKPAERLHCESLRHRIDSAS